MWSGRDRCHSGGFLLRIMPPSWHPVPAYIPRQCCRRANPILATTAAGGLFFDAATKIGIGRGKRCRNDRSRRAILRCGNEKQNRTRNLVAATAAAGETILYRHNDCAASIPKSSPEIKNRCTKDGVNRQNPASIPKSGLEIKNRCTKQPIFSMHPQQIPQHAFITR